ncbi:hypothetical protein ACFY2H_30380 [Streptomyces griseofuscus]|uniref:hypothetical protein n=1 Tax=Streptomycetaceae TaxID=2062 RepID=UPI00055BD4A2|nr:hypothetical protein [Actinacidiphila yeochonensis]
MTAYTVPLTTYADTVVRVETDLTDLDAVVELALGLVDVGSLCNYCGDIELGDEWECVTVGGEPNLTSLGGGVYMVTLTTHAGTAVDIETDLTNPGAIAERAVEECDTGSLCHQCASTVTLGDTWQPVLIDGVPTMTTHTK